MTPKPEHVRWGAINGVSTLLCAFSWVPLEILAQSRAIPLSAFILWTLTVCGAVLWGQQVAFARWVSK